MRNKTFDYLNSVITLTLLLVVGIVPLLFSGLTTDFFDMPKLIFLIVSVIVLMGLWVISFMVRGRVVITKTALDVPLLMLAVSIVVSTLFSAVKYISIYGAFPEVHGSAISWVVYILFYFLLVSNLRSFGQVKLLLQVYLVSVFVLIFVSLLSYFGVFLPFSIAQGVNFTPAGSTFSIVSMLLMVLPLSLISTVINNKFLPQPLAFLVSTLIVVTIVFIGSVPMYFVFLFAYLLCMFAVRNHLNSKNLVFFLAPFILGVLVLIFSYLPISEGGLYGRRQNFPQEVQLPLSISWKVSASAFRDAPFVGTGPSTFLYNFTNYKPVEFNQLDIWNFTFSTAYNEMLQVLGTWGLFGLLGMITIFTVVYYHSKRYVFGSELDKHQGVVSTLATSLSISAVVSLVVLLLHASTLVFVFNFIFLMACLMTVHRLAQNKTSDFAISIKLATSAGKSVDFIPFVVLVLYLVFGVFVLRKTYTAVRADYYHRLALSQADKDGTKTYEYLQKAEELNPYIDLYRVDMAQTNFALANSLATQKGPSENNPQGTLTDDDKQTIQTLITQAINEGRASVTLNPRSSRNWEVLALIYQNITGVAENSLTFALDAYGRAIQMDPYNPTLRVNVGSIYYTVKNYDLAVRFFTDSVNLKPDYINGYYNLAIALRDKGDLQSAKQIAEQAASMLSKNLTNTKDDKTSNLLKESRTKDYYTVSELLSDINNRIDAQSSGEVDVDTDGLESPGIEVPGFEGISDAPLPLNVEGGTGDNLLELIPETTITPTP